MQASKLVRRPTANRSRSARSSAGRDEKAFQANRDAYWEAGRPPAVGCQYPGTVRCNVGYTTESPAFEEIARLRWTAKAGRALRTVDRGDANAEFWVWVSSLRIFQEGLGSGGSPDFPGPAKPSGNKGSLTWPRHLSSIGLQVSWSRVYAAWIALEKFS